MLEAEAEGRARVALRGAAGTDYADDEKLDLLPLPCALGPWCLGTVSVSVRRSDRASVLSETRSFDSRLLSSLWSCLVNGNGNGDE